MSYVDLRSYYESFWRLSRRMYLSCYLARFLSKLSLCHCDFVQAGDVSLVPFCLLPSSSSSASVHSYYHRNMIKGHRNRSQNESARFSKSSINLKGFFTTGSLSKRIKTPKPSCTSDVIPDLHICSTIVTPSASMNLLPSASPKHAFRSTSKASSPRKYTQTPTSSSASFTRPEPHWFAPAEDFTPNLMSVETHSPLYQAVRKRISFTPEQFFVAPQLQLASEAVLQTQKSMGVTKIYEGTSLKRDVHETAKQTEMKEVSMKLVHRPRSC